VKKGVKAGEIVTATPGINLVEFGWSGVGLFDGFVTCNLEPLDSLVTEVFQRLAGWLGRR
jgi:hypothetical protein